MNYTEKLLTNYYQNKDILSFMKGVGEYLGMELYFETEEEAMPIKKYLDWTKDKENFSAPFQFLPAKKAFSDMYTIGMDEYEILTDMGITRKLPIIKIGEDKSNNIVFWLILKKVIFGEPSGYVISMEREALHDRLFDYHLTTQSLGTSPNNDMDSFIEFIQLKSGPTIDKFMELHNLL